jgi:hypothetical protein
VRPPALRPNSLPSSVGHPLTADPLVTDRPGQPPERGLLLAVLVVAGATLLAVALIALAVMRGQPPETMATWAVLVAAVGAATAGLILFLGKRAARRQRPQWLATQEWRGGIIARQEEGRAKRSQEGGTPEAPPGEQRGRTQ